MDWLVGLLLLLVGAMIGFFVAKFLSKKNHDASDKDASEQTIQELMHQQAVMHVQQSKQIAESLITQSDVLKQQIEAYEQQLINHKSESKESSLNYFGEHATAYLRNKSTTPHREKSNAEIQPLDFSSQSSGLFSGTEEAPTKETK